MKKELTNNIARNRYSKIKKIGEGTYGSVNQMYDNLNKQTIALKKIKFLSEDEGIPINALRQISILKHLSHPNIITIKDVHYKWQQSRFYISLEFIEENLYEHYKRYYPLSPYAVKSYLFQILNALYYMEIKGVMHRDLKPQNILVTQNGCIKICDFGQAKIYNLNDKKHSPTIATLWYKAPELLLGAEEYTSSIEIWAIGCIFAELIEGTPLFKSDCEIGQIFNIFRLFGTPRVQQIPFIQEWQYFTPSFPKFRPINTYLGNLCAQGNDLLWNMLEINPKRRIRIGKALKHDYFDGL